MSENNICQYVSMSICQYTRMQLFILGIKMKVVQNVKNKDLSFSPSWGETFCSVPVGENPFVQPHLGRNLLFSHRGGETFCSFPVGEKPFAQSLCFSLGWGSNILLRRDVTSFPAIFYTSLWGAPTQNPAPETEVLVTLSLKTLVIDHLLKLSRLNWKKSRIGRESWIKYFFPCAVRSHINREFRLI